MDPLPPSLPRSLSIYLNLHVEISKYFSTTKHLTIPNQGFLWTFLTAESIKQLCTMSLCKSSLNFCINITHLLFWFLFILIFAEHTSLHPGGEAYLLNKPSCWSPYISGSAKMVCQNGHNCSHFRRVFGFWL